MRQPIAVVGASAAGLLAAYQLARAGAPTQIYEAQLPFAPSPRTLIVTSELSRLLRLDVEDAILNRVHAFELIASNRAARLPLYVPDLVIDRACLLELLARRAIAAGAELIPGHRLMDASRENALLSLRFSQDGSHRRVRAKAVVASYGAGGLGGRSVMPDGTGQTAIAQARVRLPAGLPSDTVRCWFDRRSTRFFYWLIPESRLTAVAGTIAETPRAAEVTLERFLVSRDLSPLCWQESAWVPLPSLRFGPPRASGDPGVLPVGDAACQVKATTVGGVVPGLLGAAAAVRSLLRGTTYAHELGPLAKELNLHSLVRIALDGFADDDYDELLRLLNPQVLRVLQTHSRDHLSRAIWRLLPAQPRWLLLGARALVRGFRRAG